MVIDQATMALIRQSLQGQGASQHSNAWLTDLMNQYRQASGNPYTDAPLVGADPRFDALTGGQGSVADYLQYVARERLGPSQQAYQDQLNAIAATPGPAPMVSSSPASLSAPNKPDPAVENVDIGKGLAMVEGPGHEKTVVNATTPGGLPKIDPKLNTNVITDGRWADEHPVSNGFTSQYTNDQIEKKNAQTQAVMKAFGAQNADDLMWRGINSNVQQNSGDFSSGAGYSDWGGVPPLQADINAMYGMAQQKGGPSDRRTEIADMYNPTAQRAPNGDVLPDLGWGGYQSYDDWARNGGLPAFPAQGENGLRSTADAIDRPPNTTLPDGTPGYSKWAQQDAIQRRGEGTMGKGPKFAPISKKKRATMAAEERGEPLLKGAANRQEEAMEMRRYAAGTMAPPIDPYGGQVSDPGGDIGMAANGRGAPDPLAGTPNHRWTQTRRSPNQPILGLPDDPRNGGPTVTPGGGGPYYAGGPGWTGQPTYGKQPPAGGPPGPMTPNPAQGRAIVPPDPRYTTPPIGVPPVQTQTSIPWEGLPQMANPYTGQAEHHQPGTPWAQGPENRVPVGGPPGPMTVNPNIDPRTGNPYPRGPFTPSPVQPGHSFNLPDFERGAQPAFTAPAPQKSGPTVGGVPMLGLPDDPRNGGAQVIPGQPAYRTPVRRAAPAQGPQFAPLGGRRGL